MQILDRIACVTPNVSLQILSDMHFGVCGNHVKGRSWAQKAITAGYYWPNM